MESLSKSRRGRRDQLTAADDEDDDGKRHTTADQETEEHSPVHLLNAESHNRPTSSSSHSAATESADKSFTPSTFAATRPSVNADSQIPLVHTDSRNNIQDRCVLPQAHSDAQALTPDLDKDKKDTSTTHTIEILTAAEDRGHPSSSKGPSTVMSRFKLLSRPQGKQRRRRRLFREPITTITSSVGRKRNANTTAEAATTGGITTTTSSAAGLLAVGKPPGRSESYQDDVTGHSLSQFTSKASSGSPPHSPAIDAELGINDVRGTNGLLKRVHDSWSLIGLTIANIGPVAGRVIANLDR